MDSALFVLTSLEKRLLRLMIKIVWQDSQLRFAVNWVVFIIKNIVVFSSL